MNATDQPLDSNQVQATSLIDLSISKFFPLSIPNTHHQLRQYINTVDEDRVYIAIRRFIYCLHTPTGKLRLLGILPFEPKCIDSGFGWIGCGGSDHGDCTFMHICQDDEGSTILVRDALAEKERRSSAEDMSGDRGGTGGEEARLQQPRQTREETGSEGDRQNPGILHPRNYQEVQIRQLGGSIMNSCTIARLPADDKYAEEIIAIMTNNDTKVTVYSITEGIVMASFPHKSCVNYAKMSPDNAVLITVGDDQRTYFYSVTPTDLARAELPDGRKLRQWAFPLRRVHDMQIPRGCDSCAFSITYAQGSDKCAVGCQDGSVYVYLLNKVFSRAGVGSKAERESVVYTVVKASRDSSSGGAVRTMQFSPQPWDLLVWAEDYGRVTVVDVRRNFMRKQVICLEAEADGVTKMDVFYEQDDEDETEYRLSADRGQPRSLNRPVCDGASAHVPTAVPVVEATDSEPSTGSLSARQRENASGDAARTWFERYGASRQEAPYLPPQYRFLQRLGRRGSDEAGSSAGPSPTQNPLPMPQREMSTAEAAEQTTGTQTPRADTQEGDRTAVSLQRQRRQQRTERLARAQPQPQNHQQEPDAEADRPRPSTVRLLPPHDPTTAHSHHDPTSTPSTTDTTSNIQIRLPPALAGSSGPYTPQPPTSTTRVTAPATVLTPQRARRGNLPSSDIPPRLQGPPYLHLDTTADAREQEEDDRAYFGGFSFPSSVAPPAPVGVSPTRGPGTAGIGWSPDGRRLYVAIEKGIFEFRIDVRDRSALPAVEMA